MRRIQREYWAKARKRYLNNEREGVGARRIKREKAIYRKTFTQRDRNTSGKREKARERRQGERIR